MSFWESIREWWKERTASPLYGTFIVSVVLWNWEFFYILFWQDQDKLSFPAIEYSQMYLDDFSALHHFLYFLVFPICSTALLIFIFPILANKAHEASLRFYFDRKKAFNKANLDFEKDYERKLETIAGVKERQIALEKTLPPEERYVRDYHEFARSRYLVDFKKILGIIYEENGRIFDDENNMKLSSESLAAIHANGLVVFRDASRRNMVDLTEKGMVFAAKLLK